MNQPIALVKAWLARNSNGTYNRSMEPPGENLTVPRPQSFPPETNAPVPTLRPVSLLSALVIFLAGAVSGIGGYLGYQNLGRSGETVITTYQECIDAVGSRIQESYPQVCVTKDGRQFTEPVDTPPETPPIYPDPFSCTSDTQCVIGIQPTGCCVCPKPINRTRLGKDGWELYSSTKNYDKQSTCQTFMACAPCESPNEPVVCRNNRCTFESDEQTSDNKGYTCPKSAWVDCMPGPLEGKTTGIKFECTSEFLAWAKANCPGFQGAAY